MKLDNHCGLKFHRLSHGGHLLLPMVYTKVERRGKVTVSGVWGYGGSIRGKCSCLKKRKRKMSPFSADYKLDWTGDAPRDFFGV